MAFNWVREWAEMVMKSFDCFCTKAFNHYKWTSGKKTKCFFIFFYLSYDLFNCYKNQMCNIIWPCKSLFWWVMSSLIKYVLPIKRDTICVPAAAYFSMITTVSYNNMTTVQLIVGVIVKLDLNDMTFYYQI